MGAVAAIGEEPLIRGLALAGVRLYPAADAAEVAAAWAGLPDDIDVVIVTRRARAALPEQTEHPWPVVTP
jgi:vacuolar-type H+-ATPase subunit F/Vma7